MDDPNDGMERKNKTNLLASAPTPAPLQTQSGLEGSSVLVVDWDGPGDPDNPKNWSYKRKWITTAIVSAFALISPMSSSIIAPASDQVAAEFGIDNGVLIALATSIFVLSYAFGPLFLGPLSEIYGRSRVLQLANLWYLIWNTSCGLAHNESQLLVFRFLAGLGSSAPLSIAGGVVADCWTAEERGQAIAIYSLGPQLGPVIGPITGAWIAERSTWKWVIWSTSIAGGVVQVLGLSCLRETFAPLLLERKAEAMRKSMDAEKLPYRKIQTVFDAHYNRTWRVIMKNALVRPFALFVQEPIVQLLGIYQMYLWGLFYIFLTSIPTIFESVYKKPVGMAGLYYLALGIGQIVTTQLNAKSLDKVYLYFKNKYGGTGRPEFRLPSMFLGSLLLPIGLLITGWTVQVRSPSIFPSIGISLVGAGICINSQSIQSYVVDAFTLYAASALAAVSILRSLGSCGFPLFAPAMYSALGYGVGNTLLAAISILLGCPAPWILWHYGERIRNASRHAR